MKEAGKQEWWQAAVQPRWALSTRGITCSVGMSSRCVNHAVVDASSAAGTTCPLRIEPCMCGSSSTNSGPESGWSKKAAIAAQPACGEGLLHGSVAHSVYVYYVCTLEQAEDGRYPSQEAAVASHGPPERAFQRAAQPPTRASSPTLRPPALSSAECGDASAAAASVPTSHADGSRVSTPARGKKCAGKWSSGAGKWSSGAAHPWPPAESARRALTRRGALLCFGGGLSACTRLSRTDGICGRDGADSSRPGARRQPRR